MPDWVPVGNKPFEEHACDYIHDNHDRHDPEITEVLIPDGSEAHKAEYQIPGQIKIIAVSNSGFHDPGKYI